MEAMEAVIQAQIREVPAFATAFRAIAARGDTEDLGVVAKTSLRQMVDSLSEEQLAEAREVFQLFDLDGKGEIGTRELSFALAQLGQHPTPEELDKMVAEFDDDGDGAINFEEFLVMMDTLGWNNTEISDKDVKRLQISYYGQASIVRWLQDDKADGTGGDVTGPDIPALTRTCRQIVLTLSLEKLIYVCILVAAVISGLQSYKVDSEYEDAAWCAVVDTFILLIFGAEITVKIFAEHRKQPQHFFVDHWNTFDFVIFVGLSLTALMKLGNEVAPFRLVRLLRAVRLLRTVRLFPNLALVVETTVKSASSVVYIGMFMLLFTYMFAIVGVASFGRNDPFYFGNLARALLTLFRTVSMDSWSMIMYYNIWGCGQPNFDGNGTSRGYGDYYVETGMKCEHNPHGSFAAAYFVSFMFFTAFLILNLFIGIITTEMQAAKKEAERLRKTQNKLALATRLRMRQSDETNDEPTPDGQTRLERNPTFDDETSGN